MPRDSRPYLRDMIDEARFIESHTQGLTYESFVENELLVRAVLNSLTVLGEAARHARRHPPENARNPLARDGRCSQYHRARLFFGQSADHLEYR